MIEEAYVSFEVAKLLKERGFNDCCLMYYFLDGTIERSKGFRHKNHYYDNTQSAPTQQMVMRWLREEKGLFIEICCDDLDYNWQILNVWHRDANGDPLIKSASYGGYNEYEKACEAAIKYCLENLI